MVVGSAGGRLKWFLHEPHPSPTTSEPMWCERFSFSFSALGVPGKPDGAPVPIGCLCAAATGYPCTEPAPKRGGWGARGMFGLTKLRNCSKSSGCPCRRSSTLAMASPTVKAPDWYLESAPMNSANTPCCPRDSKVSCTLPRKRTPLANLATSASPSPPGGFGSTWVGALRCTAPATLFAWRCRGSACLESPRMNLTMVLHVMQ
mmetsp:Transcript_24619/g.59667  ORF Transcript_24619/g.59667 Transcript_24619/m.59667 type:complete len:204 (-) Transcript_24619:314-925(-)